MLGHSDVNTTRRHYAAMSDDRRRLAARKVKLRDDPKPAQKAGRPPTESLDAVPIEEAQAPSPKGAPEASDVTPTGGTPETTGEASAEETKMTPKG